MQFGSGHLADRAKLYESPRKQKTIGGTGVNTLTCSVEKGKNPWGSPHKSVNLSLYNYTKWFKNMFETSKNIIGYS